MYPQWCSHRGYVPAAVPFNQNIDSVHPLATPGVAKNYISIDNCVKLGSFYYISNTLIFTSYSSLWCITKYKKQRKRLKAPKYFFSKKTVTALSDSVLPLWYLAKQRICCMTWCCHSLSTPDTSTTLLSYLHSSFISETCCNPDWNKTIR